MSRSNRELEEKVVAGHSARAFLQDPQFIQAVEDVKTDIFNDWVFSEQGDAERREWLWHQWHALDAVLKGLRKPADEGTLAKAERGQNIYRARMEAT